MELLSIYKKRKKVEKEADMIAIRRGYGKEIFEERKLQEKYFSANKEKLGLLNKFYLSSKEIKKLITIILIKHPSNNLK